MPLTYGRDAAAPTLLLLEKIFKDIRRGPSDQIARAAVGLRRAEQFDCRNQGRG